MSKRAATSDLNHENWDEPYVAEEAGRFKEAPPDVLQKRVIKTAKRRLKTSEGNDASETPSVFASFTGFKPVTPSLGSSTKKPFSFLITGSATSSNVTPLTNGTALTAVSAKITHEQKQLADLQHLNRSVNDQIKSHVDKNPNFSINQQQVQEKEEEDDKSDEPPKVEFTHEQEGGSVFSTRCKVFVKKENSYKEQGVGKLFIKKVGENKHQLLVRAETVMGNVLLNVLLSSGIPTQRMGKNNVMLVCLPTPQDLPPPTTVLLRVKTDVEADQLLNTIERYKPE